ncbi:hypothetical protein SAMN05216338_1003316 [Bradyrhizobium sp. Rc2d]|nr:hypothetical protein SAMN05216338_1003316 [Bradyrhizobium sp. Rc2d]
MACADGAGRSGGASETLWACGGPAWRSRECGDRHKACPSAPAKSLESLTRRGGLGEPETVPMGKLRPSICPSISRKTRASRDTPRDGQVPGWLLVTHSTLRIRNPSFARVDSYHPSVRSLHPSTTGGDCNHTTVAALHAPCAGRNCSHSAVSALHASTTRGDCDHTTVSALHTASAGRDRNHTTVAALHAPCVSGDRNHVTVRSLHPATAIWNSNRYPIRPGHFSRHVLLLLVGVRQLIRHSPICP